MQLATSFAFFIKISISTSPYAKATPILLYLRDVGFPKILKSVSAYSTASENPVYIGYSKLSLLAKITDEAPFLCVDISNRIR